jgi:hypothetical protein
MKYLSKALCLCAATLLVPAAATAGSYAGFDLCEPATPDAIKKTIEGAGGLVTRVVDQTYPDELIVIGKNYPIAVAPRLISVTLYKGKVAYISIGNAGDLVPGIEAKYGNDFRTSKKEEKVGITTSHHFQDPSDKSLELTISKFDVANQKGTFFSVSYACKDLYAQVEKAREAFTKPDAKK